MNRRLRHRHRWMVLGLALVLPAAFSWTLASRRLDPGTGQLPAVLADPPAGHGQVLAVREFLLGSVIVNSRLMADSASRQMTLEITPRTDPREPDPLLYWSPEAPEAESGSGVPPDAVLLGSLRGTRTRSFPLPKDAATRDGSLLLYSLGHQSVLGAATLPTQSLLAQGAAARP